MSVDPLNEKYPELSAYQYASNRPIVAIDLDGLEAYYMDDGTKVGQIGDNNEVKLFNEGITTEDATKYIEYANILNGNSNESSFFNRIKTNATTSFLEKNTTSVGMTEEELNMRAFMTVLRIAENGNTGEPLDYNAIYGGEKFTDYSDHPRKTVSKWGRKSDSAGAYQFLSSSWDMVKGQLNLQDFSPSSQDKAVIELINQQELGNPSSKGINAEVREGKIQDAISKLNYTWTSLPGGPQEQMKMPDAIKEYKKAISNELRGQTVIATKQGQLFK